MENGRRNRRNSCYDRIVCNRASSVCGYERQLNRFYQDTGGCDDFEGTGDSDRDNRAGNLVRWEVMVKQEEGNIGEYLAVGLSIVLMAMVMVAFMNSLRLVAQKDAISQISRKYILRMETVGGLNEDDRIKLLQELENTGATELSLDGSTIGQVNYGEEIILCIRGKVQGEYEFEDRKVSIAKH